MPNPNPIRNTTVKWTTPVVGLELVMLLQSSFVGTKSVGIASVGKQSVGIVWCTLGDAPCILMRQHAYGY